MGLTGCHRQDIQVYRVAKEAVAADPHAGHNHPPGQPHTEEPAGQALPKVTYKTPSGWEEVAAGEMRAASFRVKSGSKLADVGIVPLPGLAGGDLGNVNRWRAQVGLPAITEEELPKTAEKVTIAGVESQAYELAGENASSGEKTRVLGAILRKDGVAWFFKMIGDDELVAQSKASFIEFLKSVSFQAVSPDLPPSHPPVDAASMAAQSFPTQSGTPAKPTWQVPAGWNEVPGGQFLVAKFAIAGENNSQAAVNISMSAGDGGGLVGNVNRWRRQVGLGEAPAAEITSGVTPLEVEGGKASLVTIGGTDPKTGEKVKVLGVMLSQPSRTWFYKLTGPEQLVDQQRNNFLKFIQSAKHSHAS